MVNKLPDTGLVILSSVIYTRVGTLCTLKTKYQRKTDHKEKV